MSNVSSLCRFCAKEQSPQSMVDLKADVKHRSSILQMVSIFRDEFVDFRSKNLPETICTVCTSILRTCYKFYKQVGESQTVINSIYNTEVEVDLPSTDVTEILSRELRLNSNDNEIVSNWSAYPWLCAHCTTRLPSKEDLIQHCQETHGTCNGFRCADCGQKIKQFDHFVEHVKQERMDLRKYCEFCNIKMENSTHKETHKFDHKCCLCGQVFTTKSLLQNHLNKNKPTSSSSANVVDLQNIKIDTETIENGLINNTDNNSSNISHTQDVINYSEYRNNLAIDDTIYTFNVTREEENNAIFLLNNTLLRIKDQTSRNNVSRFSQVLNDDEIMKNSIDIMNKIKHELNKEKNKARQKIDKQKTRHFLNNRKHKLIKTKDKMNKLINKTNTDTNATYKMNSVNELDVKIESWSDYPQICKYCNIKLAYKDMLFKHCIETHKKCFGNKCIDCDSDVFDTIGQFVEHVKEHRPYLKNICPYCDVNDIIDTDHLEMHKTRHQCSKCGQSFLKMRDLRRHDVKVGNPVKKTRFRRTGPITDKDVTCDLCGKRLKTPLSLRCHKTTHTIRKRDHTCERCGKAFYTKDTLEGHKKLHEISKETCQICSKDFVTIQRLKRHVKTHNLKLPFQCDDCKKFFNSKDSLRAHVFVHLDIKPFECKYCLKRFRHKHVMKIHENQHTGARPYSCDVCCINFACWSNCDKHMRRIHGTSLAKTVKTPHGKVAIDPETGKPSEVSMSSVVEEWGRNLLEKSSRGSRRNSLKNSGDFDLK